MKKIKLQILIIILAPIVIFSQTMNVYKNNGSVDSFNISEIDSITFTTTQSGGTGGPCGGITTVTYEGKVYNTIKIGNQCWLKENLNVGTMIQGNEEMQAGNAIEKYCYDNNESNCNTYGGLYQWNEAMQYVTAEGTQGICPNGWHIPTYAEMQVLDTYVNHEATKLIDKNAKSGNTYSNESGFSALFAGYRSNSGFSDLNDLAGFWSSTAPNNTNAYRMSLYYIGNNILFDENTKILGYSIRCLKD